MNTVKLFLKNLGLGVAGFVIMAGIIGVFTALHVAVGYIGSMVVTLVLVAAFFTVIERKHRAEIRELEAPYLEPEECPDCGETECEARDNIAADDAERESARAEFDKLKQAAHEAYWRRVRAQMARETDEEFEAWLLKRKGELAE